MATLGNPHAGQLAATFQAIEIQKLVTGEMENVAAAREVLNDARHHAHLVSQLVRNPHCRFAHEPSWEITSTPDLPLGAALELAGGSAADSRLAVPDSAFLSQRVCPDCDLVEAVWRLREGLGRASLPCPRCQAARPPRGFDLQTELSQQALPAPLLERPLSERGLRAGEIFAVEAPGSLPRYFELLGPRPAQPGPQSEPGRDIVLAGLGNIGSFGVPALARIPGLGRVTLCDFDRYEEGNQFGQDFAPWAVGHNKAEAQAMRLRGLHPGLDVRAFPGRAEDLPLGRLRGAITVSCLDSRAARLRLAARAWRVGSPFVDAAVEGGESLLVRTSVILPSDDGPCFECAMSPEDYANLEQVFPCATPEHPAAAAARAD
ncbi:MAG: ThiF family adenylyltransferase [Deltaproteobacteria bacterium]|nr:ThiF family adenylyltransferase [Deltaproteobacteria bacterium]MBW2362720.1 ThiF family adenylyltransferase [Deltaproteobacteria bacterium]